MKPNGQRWSRIAMWLTLTAEEALSQRRGELGVVEVAARCCRSQALQGQTVERPARDSPEQRVPRRPLARGRQVAEWLRAERRPHERRCGRLERLWRDHAFEPHSLRRRRVVYRRPDVAGVD